MPRGRRTAKHAIPDTMRYLLRRSRLGFTVFDSGKSIPVETFTRFSDAQRLCRTLNAQELPAISPETALGGDLSPGPVLATGFEAPSVCEGCSWQWQAIPGGTHYYELTNLEGTGFCPSCEATIELEQDAAS
jgi:hypothetical protein